MNRNDWKEFKEYVYENPTVNRLKNWADKNGVVFEPYARNTDDDSLNCTCCYFGDIEAGDNNYIFLSIGDNNGSWEGPYDDQKEVEDEYGCMVSIPAEPYDYEQAFDNEMNNAYIQHQLDDKQTKSFENEFGVAMSKAETIRVNDFGTFEQSTQLKRIDDEPNE